MRSEWSSFLKWTAGISIFFITASLTFSVFQVEALGHCLGGWSIGFLIATLAFSIITIAFAWGLFALNIFRIVKAFADLPFISEEEVRKKYTTRYEIAINAAGPLQGITLVCFGANILSFTAFLLSVICQ